MNNYQINLTIIKNSKLTAMNSQDLQYITATKLCKVCKT